MNVMSRNLCDTCQYLFSYKYMICAQSLFKYITNSSKSILVRLYSTKYDNHKNYYNTLKITPHATQSEIKSAYYKLSLQYHPDKNKSDYAKQKFQDISDAYEVLSNHEQRKNYDRHMMICQQPVTNVKKSQHRDKISTGSKKIYNFDAWTQAHYGKQFEIERIRRSNYQQQKKIDEMSICDRETHSSFIEYILSFITVIFLIALYYQKDYDVPIYKEEKRAEKRK